MRNLKKFLALVLAMLMVVSAAATVSAFDDVTEEHDFYVAIQDLVGKEIVQGKDENTFDPDGNVTRLQAAIMFARALTGETDPTNAYWNKGLSQFSDVTEFQYAVTVAVNAGIINGMGDGTYNPTGDIQFIQALKMAVCALGYGEGLTWGADGMEYYNVAVDLGLTAGLDYITEANKALTRGEFAQLIYNMIYADLADGTGSIAYNVFKVGYVEPVEPADEMTTFIITATDGQTAYEGMIVTETGYVGIQQLVNGVPAGEVIYIPVEAFGFEADEDEANFLHAFNLANYDAETGAFDYIEATGDSWKIYNTEVTDAKDFNGYSRFTYGSANYYAVEALDEDAIRNEVVLFSTTDYGTNTGKELFLNAKGQVMSKEGDLPVLEAVYSVNGNIVSYRVLNSEVAPDGVTAVTKGQYLSVEKATELFGEVIYDVARPYDIMKATGLKSAYELTVFDDDNDGKMDRAYYTPVYMAVKNGLDSGKEKTEGPMKGVKGVTYTEELDLGDVFVYTYNKQLKQVTVLEVIEAKEGTIKNVNTNNKSVSDKYYSTINLTDGTSLTLYNTAKMADTANTKLGAIIKAATAVDQKDATLAHSWLEQITLDYKFNLIDDTLLLAKLKAGSLFRYYERNGIVIFAETYNIEDAFERVILKDVVDADLEAVYLDVYKNGKVEEIAVTMIDNKAISELSWIKISSVLNAIAANDNKGNIYKISERENGYQISSAMTDKNYGDFKLLRVNALKQDGTLDTVAATTNIVIEDGNAIAVPNTYNKYNRLRSSDSTVWYFINNGKVRVFEGEPEHAEIAFKTGTVVYADKLGWSGKTAGDASEIYVLNADLDLTTGFGWGKKDTSVVFVSGAIDKETTWNYYTQGSADEFGLDVEDAEASYYKYNADYILDMETATGKVVYSKTALKAGTFYNVDEDGIVVDTAVVIGTTNDSTCDVYKTSLKLSEITLDDEAITIGTNLTAVYEIDALYGMKADAKTSATKLNSKLSDILSSTATTVYMLSGYTSSNINTLPDEDGKFAIIVGDISIYEDEYTAPKGTVAVNAQYTIDTRTFATVANITATATSVTGTATIYDVDFDNYNQKINLDTAKKITLKDADMGTYGWNIKAVKADGTIGDKVVEDTDGTATLTSKMNAKDEYVLDFALSAKIGSTPFATLNLAAGNYVLTLVVNNTLNSSNGTYTIFFTVPAAN